MALNVNRRQFLVLGSTAIAGVSLGMPAYGMHPVSSSFVSVGYRIPVLRTRSRRFSGPPTFSRAESLLTGDPGFFRNGARFRIHGFRRASHAPQPERVSLDVMFPAAGLEEKASYFAWTTVASNRRDSTSNSVAFDVPVESTGTVDLRVQRAPLGSGVPSENAAIAFAVNSGPEAIKLNPGTYAFAFLRAGEPLPDWEAVRLDGVTTETKVPMSLVGFDGSTPVDFDYLLLTVAYAEDK